jgi:transcriptional regulator with XRE-family HTH domain
MPGKTTHHAAIETLLPEQARAEHARRVQSLLARNALLTALESTRERQGITKQALAKLAGLDASSVRRLLTSTTANPTTDNAFRLMAAMDITLEATLPTGERVQLVTPTPKRGQIKPSPQRRAARSGRDAKPRHARQATLNDAASTPNAAA